MDDSWIISFFGSSKAIISSQDNIFPTTHAPSCFIRGCVWFYETIARNKNTFSSYSNYTLLDNLQLFYDTGARLLICTRDSCQFALSNGPSRVITHLRDKHNVSTDARKGLNQLLKSLSPGPLDPESALTLADRTAEHDKLRVYEGFACINCQFRTINIQSIRRHQSNPPDDCRSKASLTRSSRRRNLDQQFDCVYLQTWTTGSARRYWIINRGRSMVRQVDSPAVQAHLRSVLTREFNRGKLPNEITAAPPVAPTDTTAFALQTPWLERTGWDRTYNNKDRRESRDVLAALAASSFSRGAGPYLLGRQGTDGLHEDIFSTMEDERKIAAILEALDVLLDRCEETACKTSRSILCWLRSMHALACYLKPFILVYYPLSRRKY
ncbi:hypothetical protein QL093DRAFT_2570444 [Fusarium oxysporum]|nr:hypothetical protein QL093DRAFT_2570444 [Fusarium oxysporum]